ncbi:hypothetical protein CEXT_117291 [Caerostris extrusa]|uniref:Uncharacterized protein n=1 Tax=Caerostris extrusa TaxID=172846 RepID=A0AAV4NRT1_CAEEX|nr:hypothetical protein CEXT_117291 [Caerostris extrusa]
MGVWRKANCSGSLAANESETVRILFPGFTVVSRSFPAVLFSAVGRCGGACIYSDSLFWLDYRILLGPVYQ